MFYCLIDQMVICSNYRGYLSVMVNTFKTLCVAAAIIELEPELLKSKYFFVCLFCCVVFLIWKFVKGAPLCSYFLRFQWLVSFQAGTKVYTSPFNNVMSGVKWSIMFLFLFFF